MRCGIFHEKLSECNKDYFCIFCKENHRYTDQKCVINQQAKEIERMKNNKEITIEKARELYSILNKAVKRKGKDDERGRSRLNIQNNSGTKPKNRNNVADSWNSVVQVPPVNISNSFSELELLDESFSLELKRNIKQGRQNRGYKVSSPNRVNKKT